MTYLLGWFSKLFMLHWPYDSSNLESSRCTRAEYNSAWYVACKMWVTCMFLYRALQEQLVWEIQMWVGLYCMVLLVFISCSPIINDSTSSMHLLTLKLALVSIFTTCEIWTLMLTITDEEMMWLFSVWRKQGLASVVGSFYTAQWWSGRTVITENSLTMRLFYHFFQFIIVQQYFVLLMWNSNNRSKATSLIKRVFRKGYGPSWGQGVGLAESYTAV